MLIDADQLRIGQRGLGPVVGQSQIASHHERGTEDGPESKEGSLLVVSQTSRARLFPAGNRLQAAEGKHVRVGPMSGTRGSGPFRGAGKLISDALRKVLIVYFQAQDGIRDTPHLRVAAQ